MADNPFSKYLGSDDEEATVAPTQVDKSNHFSKYLGPDDEETAPEEQSSAFGSAVRGFERGVLPAAGGILGGMATASAVGSAFGPLGTLGGAIVGGIGGIATGTGVAAAQDYALSKAPESWQDALGGTEEQQKIDREQHPYASFIGGMLPFAITMEPGGFAKPADYEGLTNFEKILAHPVTSRLFSGSVVGGVELGQELLSGEKPDWANVATATAFGMVFNEPNTLGKKIEKWAGGLGTKEAEAVLPKPTVADAQDLVLGTGRTEEAFRKEEKVNEEAETSNRAAKQAEMMIQGRSPVLEDIETEARATHPEVFQEHDALVAQRKEIGDKIQELSVVPEQVEGKTFEQSSEDQLASLKEKWTIVDGELQRKSDQVNTAIQRIAEKNGVNLSNISDEQNRQSYFNYFHDEALKDIARGGATVAEENPVAWASMMAERYMTQAQRMGFYQPHGVAFGQGQGRTLAQSPGFLPGFYSGIEHAVMTGKQERASGDQWLGQLRNSQTVKPDEIKALGLEDWLKGQGKVSRSELLDYVRANSLEMEEVQKGDFPVPASTVTREGYNPNAVEYGHVVLPGTDLKDYHEFLWTLPNREPAFQDSHWPEHPNVVGWSRFSIRTNPETGKKELIIHEQQSGWHEEGNKKGYLDPAVWRQRKDEYDKADADVNKAIEDSLKFENEHGKELAKEFQLQREGKLEQSDLIDKYYDLNAAHDTAYNDFVLAKDAFEHIRYTNVPDAPFKTTWPELILKRMLRYAAENGIEKVSWPGDAKTVAKVEGWPEPKQVPANPNRYKVAPLEFTDRYVIEHGTQQDDYSGIPDRNIVGQHFTKQEAENRLGALNAAKWVVDHGGGYKWDATAIIERYTKDLPKIAEKLGKKYEAKVKSESDWEKADKSDELRFNSVSLPKDFQSSILEKGFPLYQGGAQPLARVTISPDASQKLIEVLKRANESSLWHESGHIFLAELAKDAAHPKAPQQIRDDFATALSELGATREQWDNWQKPKLSVEENKAFNDFHERFARAFEQYSLKGKAPSSSLARVFEMMKEWLTHIYGQFVRQGEELPDALRGVFDRLLATDKQIEEYRSGEAKGAPTLFDIHSGAAREASNEEARPLAQKIAAERASAQPPQGVSNEIAQAQTDLRGTTGGGAEGLRGLDAGGDQTGNEPRGDNVGAGGGEKRVSGGKPPAESSSEQGKSKSNPIAPTAARTYPRGTGSRFVDERGNFSLKDVNNFEDLKQLEADMIEKDQLPDGPATPGMVLDLANAMGLNGLTNRIGLNAKQIRVAQALLGKASIEAVTARKAVAETPSYIRPDSPEFKGVFDNIAEYEKSLQRMRFMMGVYGDTRTDWAHAGHALQNLKKQWQAEIENIAAMTGKTFNQILAEAKLGTGMDDPFKNAKWIRDIRKPEGGRFLSELFTNDILSGPATHITYVLSNMISAIQKTVLDVPMASLIGAVRQHFDPTRERVYFSEAVARGLETYRSVPKGLQAGMESLYSGQQIRQEGEPTRLLPGWRKLTRAEMKAPPPGQYLTQEDLARAIAQSDVRWNEVGASFFGLMRGIRDSFISHGEVLAAGGTPKFSITPTRSQLGVIPGFDIQAGGVGFHAPVGNVLRLPTRAVAGLHSLQYTMNYSVEVNAWAWRQAIKDGYTPYSEAHSNRMAELKQAVPKAVMEHSSTNSYNLSLLREGGEFTKRLSWFFNLAPELPFLGETPIFKFIDPFIRISANIFHQNILERTPLGMLAPSVRREILGQHFSDKDTAEVRGLKQVDQDVALARMVTGSLMSIFFGGLAYEGYLTGAGPTDPHKRAVWEVNGYKEHSIRIGDINYSIARLGSFGMLASSVADLYQVAHIASKEDKEHAAMHLAHAFLQNIADESFFRGVGDLAQAIEDPKGHGQQWINNFVPGFIPYEAFLNQENHAIDPYTRNARTVVDAIMAKLPWESQQLTPRRDIWGEPIRNPDALIGKGVTAIYEYQISRDPVNVALKQLDVGIAQPPRTIRNVKLTDQEYDDFQRFSGRLLKQRLNAFVTSSYWNQLDPNMKRMTVQEFVTQSRNVAREIMLGKYHHITADATRLRAHRYDDVED